MHNGPVWWNVKVALKLSAASAAIFIVPGTGFAQSAPLSAAAQQNDAGAEPVVPIDGETPDILVTGSNIRGNASATTSLTIITRDDFERSGFLNVGQAVASLPQSFGGGLTVETNAIGITQDRGGVNTSTATSPNLRALGPGATLTLLNGDRLTPAGIGLAVDLSLIPTAAIERVDVLADGASATYGTDAVAGVVNVITRRKYDGVETRALFGGARDGMTTYNGSVLAGKTIGRFSGVISGEFFHQGSLYASDRAAAKNLISPYTIIPDQRRASVMGSATFEISPILQLFADGFYTSSKIKSEYANTVYTSSGTNTSEQYVADIGANANLGATWHLSASGRISENSPVLFSKGVLSTGSTFVTNWDRTLNMKSIQAVADGTLLEIPGGGVKASLGVSFRNEKIRSENTPAAAANRNVASAFAETAIPLLSPEENVPFIRRLSITAAGRFDSYGGDIGSAFVPKFSGSWEINDSLEIRASYSRSYRAPSLYENSESYVAYLRTVKDSTAGGTSKALWLQGTGRALNPEKSNNLDLQIRIHPPAVKGLDFSLGYYRFLYRNRIADPDPNTVAYSDIRNALPIMLDRSPTSAEIASLIKGASTFGGGDPSGVSVIIDSRFVNVAKTTISGLEGLIIYVTSIGSSTLGVHSSINYIDKFDDVIVPQAGVVSRVGTLFSPPHWRARSSVDWSRKWLSASVTWNHIGPYFDTRAVGGAPSNVPVDAWNTFDLGLTLHLSANRERDTRLSLVATNLFDAGPPYVANTSALRPANWDPTNASVVGRFISLELVKKW